MATQTYTAKLRVVHCGECEATFGMEEQFYEARLRDRRTWYCPNGHPRVFRKGQTTEEQLRAELKAERHRTEEASRRAASAEGVAKRERDRANGFKGAMRKARKRIAHGVCPCCKRSFENLARHMASQHPEELV